MCGINGIFSRQPGTDILSIGNRMNKLIQHRGPDDEGSVLFDRFSAFPMATPQSVKKLDGINYLAYTQAPAESIGWFGHQRLSILDLSALGHEPMADDTGNYWLTYNGEVYNYLEIKQELQAEGVQFKSGTDAEVVLKAYIQWGESCVDRFNGMWAFAIYNVEQRTLFASRDRFGVKPFYYYFSPTHFIFSS